MKRAPFLGTLALACVALAGCGPAIPPVGNYATVSGTVTDAASGQPIVNATVTIDSALTAVTDAGGHYRVEHVPFGPWSYVVSAPNYGSRSDTSPPDLLAGEQRVFPITLQHS